MSRINEIRSRADKECFGDAFGDRDWLLKRIDALAAELVAARARIAYLEGALRVIADGTICPDLFPNETDEHVIAAKTAMVTAIAALEHSEAETK